MDNPYKQPLLSRQKVAGLLGISVPSVNLLIAKGELEAKRIGKKHVRILTDSVARYLNGGLKGGGNDQ